MPTYNFACECGYAAEVFMKMDDYQPVIECPQCQGEFRRTWTGDSAPNIKTGKRMEDLWKQMGWMDPEDPDYHKVNAQRVRAMREKAIKERDDKLNKEDMKKGRTKDFKPTKRRGDHVSKQDLDKLPDVAKDRVNVDEIAKKSDDK